MTPKEKAGELVDKFWKSCYDKHDIAKLVKADAKQCALIAVDEILKAVDNPDETYLMKHSVEYWSQVKQEIENL